MKYNCLRFLVNKVKYSHSIITFVLEFWVIYYFFLKVRDTTRGHW